MTQRIVTATALAFLGCLLTAGLLAAQPRPEAVDPEAELVVAMPDDTQNMDPRLGMGSVRSTYIRQVFESLVDTDPQGRPVPGLAVSWKPVGDNAASRLSRNPPLPPRASTGPIPSSRCGRR